MALNKQIGGKVKIAPISTTICYLEISVDNGASFDIIDSMTIQPNVVPSLYSFPNYATIDVSNPNLIIKIRVQSSTSTTTTTSTSTSSTTSTTSTTSSTTSTTTSSSSSSTTLSPGRQFILSPDVNGRVLLDNTSNTYLPGDTFILQGQYKLVYFTNFTGTSQQPFIVKNADGIAAQIGDEAWNGGSWATAFQFDNCHYFIVGSNDANRNNFLISGSTSETSRDAYFNLVLRNHTDNVEIKNLKIQNGGTGIWAKTDPVEGDSSTWFPNSYMENLLIHNVEVSGTKNENMYIGHTATHWNLTKNQPYYGIIGDTSNPQWYPGDHYVDPIKWRNVRIYNNYCHDGFADGIQTAAIENLYVYNNEVINWGRGNNSAHNGGILIGGRVNNFEAYCNYVHDGWGELFQCYAEGLNNAFGRVYNNLFLRTTSNDGVSFRITDNLVIDFYDNTVLDTYGVSTRFYTGTGHRIKRNILAQPRSGTGNTLYPTSYIYLEPGASVSEGTGLDANGKYATITDAKLDSNNWYLPNSDSPAINWGFRKSMCDFVTSTSTSTTSSSTTSSSTTSTTSSSTTSTTTTVLPTTTTTTTTGLPGTFVKISNWKSDSPNQYGWIYTPPGYNPSDTTKKYPFIVFLHGQGEIGTGSAAADILVAAGKGPGQYFNSGDTPQNVIVFLPQLPSVGTWEPNWVEAARSYVINNYNGDSTRFYLTGLSLGASGTSKYVMTYPDRVAAYLLATGDTQYQRGSNTGATVNGVRQVDVPGWFHAGTADGTISVNNGIDALTAMNAVMPKPIYPYLVDTYWNLGHDTNMWDTKVYNRKYRTDAVGTSAFDYIQWFMQYKVNDLVNNSDSYVKKAEMTKDYTDYLMALRIANKISDIPTQQAHLGRLGVVKSAIDSTNKIVMLNFGNLTAIGNMNIINISNGQSVNNLIDINGNATTIGFALSGSQWNPPDIAIGFKQEYFGFDSTVFDRGFRVYNNATWTITGLNNSKTYKLRFFYGDMSYNNTQHSGGNILINGVNKLSDNAMVNTTKYVDYDNISPISNSIVCTMTSLQSNWQCDYTAMLIYESVSVGTTTTSTSSTTSTTSSTTSTTTSTSSTTSTTSSSTTSTTSTTSSTTTTTSSSTTTTSTTTSSTTTTTTTLIPEKLTLSAIDNGNTFNLKWTNNRSALTNNPLFIGIGSSTLEGIYGASSYNTSYAGLFQQQLTNIATGIPVFANNALGGTNISQALPVGTASGINENRSITLALSANPSGIILGFASNEPTAGITPTQWKDYVVQFFNLAKQRNIPLFVVSPLPRTQYNSTQQQQLVDARNLIKSSIPDYAFIDMLDLLRDTSSANPATINPIYDSGDGIHVNDAGHNLIYTNLWNKVNAYYSNPTYTQYLIETANVSNSGDIPTSWNTLDTITDGSIINKNYNRIDGNWKAYRITATKPDSSTTTISDTIWLRQEIYAGYIMQKMQLDFSLDTIPAPSSDWNNLVSTSSGPALNSSFNLNDINGTSTGATLTVTQLFTGANGTGGNSGIYPDNVLKDNWYSSKTQTNRAQIKLSGLSTNNVYSIDFMSSIAVSTNNKVLVVNIVDNTSFNKCGQLNSCNPSGIANVNNVLTIPSIKPNISGEIYIDIYAGGDTANLTALVLSKLNNDSTTTSSTTSTSSSTSTTTSTSSTTTSTTSTSSSTTTSTTTTPPTGVARFNFNATAQNISGWQDISGSPDTGVISVTDSINGTGITVSSIAGKWSSFGGTSNNGNGGTGVNSDFPSGVMLSYWYNYYNVYTSNGGNIKISNLTPNKSYQIKMIGSRSSTAGSGIPAGQNRIMEFIVSQTATISDVSEQSKLDYAARDSVTTQTFTITSNASGEIYLGVYPSRNGNGTNGDQFGYINGLIVIP